MERPAPVLMSGTKLPFGSTELHFLCEDLGLCVTSLDLTCWDSHRTRPSGQHRAEGGEQATGTEARSWAAPSSNSICVATTTCVALGKFINLSAPLFPHL